MALEFDKINSEIEIVDDTKLNREKCNVEEEIDERRKMLYERTTKCKIIKPMNRTQMKLESTFAYKFICVCPQYHPCYPCKHTGNIIIDRDVLTRDEHLCILATPRPNLGAPRKPPRFYHKRVLLPHSSARIAQLAIPKKILVKGTMEDYIDVLTEEQMQRLQILFERNEAEVQPTNIETALAYVEEEIRLNQVLREKQRKKCKLMKKKILAKQKRQIKKIVCVLFEEMKDFLLNDQFLIDECSMLTRVILEKIREFTEDDFYSTSNLREYQKVLANNMAVWINKFISALSIFVTQPQQPEQTGVKTADVPEPDTFLPVWDYMSLSEDAGEEATDVGGDGDYISAVEESVREVSSKEIQSVKLMDYDMDFANQK